MLGVTAFCVLEDYAEALANDGHVVLGLPADALALASEKRLVNASPVFKGAISFALGGCELGGNRVEWDDVDPAGLNDAYGVAGKVGDDAQIALPWERLVLPLTRPHQVGGCPFPALDNQRGEFIGTGLVVVEVERFEEARGGVDRACSAEGLPERGVARRNVHRDA